jgi:hypothetical protein
VIVALCGKYLIAKIPLKIPKQYGYVLYSQQWCPAFLEVEDPYVSIACTLVFVSGSHISSSVRILEKNVSGPA